ncbi:MAG: hypothetical protein DKINENOH_05392 [bacterium]|nr:hypothetical protein [bacterium]
MDTAGDGRQKFRAEIIMHRRDFALEAWKELPAAGVTEFGSDCWRKMDGESTWPGAGGIDLALGWRLASPLPRRCRPAPKKAGGLPAASIFPKKGNAAGCRFASSTAKRRKRLLFNCLNSSEAPIQRCGVAIRCSAPEQGGKWIYQPLYCWPKLAL